MAFYKDALQSTTGYSKKKQNKSLSFFKTCCTKTLTRIIDQNPSQRQVFYMAALIYQKDTLKCMKFIKPAGLPKQKAIHQTQLLHDVRVKFNQERNSMIFKIPEI